MAIERDTKATVKGAIKKVGQAVRGRTGIYGTLAQEHGEIDALLSRLSDTEADQGDERRALFDQLKTELLGHVHSEDAIFYTVLETHPKTKELINHSRDEHHDIEVMLDELSTMPVSQKGWIELVRRLRAKVKSHVEEEEKQVFPLAQDVLSRDDAKQLDERYHQHRAGQPISAA